MRSGFRAWPRRRRIIAAAIACGAIYAAALSYLSIAQHAGLRTYVNDLGNADQALWAAANGDWSMTQSNTIDGVPRSRLGVHVNLMFYPLSLLYRVWADPVILLVLGSLACAAAGLAVFALALRRFGATWWAMVPPGAFWLSPMVHDATLFDFHSITLVAAFFAWAVYLFDARRPVAGAVLLLCALCCKEDVAFLVSAYGAFLWLTGRRREGASVAAGAIAFGVLTLGVLVPLATGGELEKLAGPGNRYGWLGDGMAEVLWTTVTSPVAVLGELLRPDKLRLPLYLLVCGGFVCGRAWRFLLLLVPLLAVGLLAAGSWMTRVTGTYYWITAELVVVMACVLAASPRRPRFAIGRGRLAYLGAATLAVSVALSPLPYGAFASWDDFRPSPSARTFAEVRALIPPDAAVSVQTNLGAHLSQRADVAQFPRRLHCADFALLHLRYEGGPRLGLFTQANMYFLTHHPQPRALPSAARRLVEDPRWSLVFSGEGFYLFARGAPAIVSDAEALGRIERDAAVLRRQLDSTAPVSFRMARYLNGPLDWKDLL